MERQQTIMSNVSQTAGIGGSSPKGFKRQNSKHAGSHEKVVDLSMVTMGGSPGKDKHKLKNIKDVTNVNTNSPRFELARKQLDIPESELKIKKRKEFNHDENGYEVDPELAKVRYKNYNRRLVQTYNLVMEQRQRNIVKSIKEQVFKTGGDMTQNINQGTLGSGRLSSLPQNQVSNHIIKLVACLNFIINN